MIRYRPHSTSVWTTATTVVLLLSFAGPHETTAQTIEGRISIPTAFYKDWPALNHTVQLIQVHELPRIAYDVCRQHDMEYSQLAEGWSRIQRERRSGRYTALGLDELVAEQQEIVDSIIALFQWTSDWMREGLNALTVDEAFTGVGGRYQFSQIPAGEYALWAETDISGVRYQWWTEVVLRRGESIALNLGASVFAEAGLPFSCDRFGFGGWRKVLGPLPERRWMRVIRR